MLILALDTTSEVGGVGIFRGHQCLAQVANDDPANRYAITLFSMVDQAVEEARARHGVPTGGLAEMGMIAVASGPGSFTGIRVGLAAAQGWTKVFGMPVRGVSVLEALVEAAQIRTEWVVPILDARRGEFYVGLFQATPGAPLVGASGRPQGSPVYTSAGEDCLLKPAEVGPYLASRLPEGSEASCVFREHDRAAQALPESLSGALQRQTVAGTLVESVARLGLRDYGKPQPPGSLDAYYIRRPDAEMQTTSDSRKSIVENRNSKIEI